MQAPKAIDAVPVEARTLLAALAPPGPAANGATAHDLVRLVCATFKRNQPKGGVGLDLATPHGTRIFERLIELGETRLCVLLLSGAENVCEAHCTRTLEAAGKRDRDCPDAAEQERAICTAFTMGCGLPMSREDAEFLCAYQREMSATRRRSAAADAAAAAAASTPAQQLPLASVEARLRGIEDFLQVFKHETASAFGNVAKTQQQAGDMMAEFIVFVKERIGDGANETQKAAKQPKLARKQTRDISSQSSEDDEDDSDDEDVSDVSDDSQSDDDDEEGSDDDDGSDDDEDDDDDKVAHEKGAKQTKGKQTGATATTQKKKTPGVNATKQAYNAAISAFFNDTYEEDEHAKPSSMGNICTEYRAWAAIKDGTAYEQQHGKPLPKNISDRTMRSSLAMLPLNWAIHGTEARRRFRLKKKGEPSASAPAAAAAADAAPVAAKRKTAPTTAKKPAKKTKKARIVEELGSEDDENDEEDEDDEDESEDSGWIVRTTKKNGKIVPIKEEDEEESADSDESESAKETDASDDEDDEDEDEDEDEDDEDDEDDDEKMPEPAKAEKKKATTTGGGGKVAGKSAFKAHGVTGEHEETMVE